VKGFSFASTYYGSTARRHIPTIEEKLCREGVQFGTENLNTLQLHTLYVTHAVLTAAELLNRKDQDNLIEQLV